MTRSTSNRRSHLRSSGDERTGLGEADPVVLERCRHCDYFSFFDDLLRMLSKPIDEIFRLKLLIRTRKLRFPSSFAVSSTSRSLALIAPAIPPAAMAALSEGGRGGG